MSRQVCYLIQATIHNFCHVTFSSFSPCCVRKNYLRRRVNSSSQSLFWQLSLLSSIRCTVQKHVKESVKCSSSLQYKCEKHCGCGVTWESGKLCLHQVRYLRFKLVSIIPVSRYYCSHFRRAVARALSCSIITEEKETQVPCTAILQTQSICRSIQYCMQQDSELLVLVLVCYFE